MKRFAPPLGGVFIWAANVNRHYYDWLDFDELNDLYQLEGESELEDIFTAENLEEIKDFDSIPVFDRHSWPSPRLIRDLIKRRRGGKLI